MPGAPICSAHASLACITVHSGLCVFTSRMPLVKHSSARSSLRGADHITRGHHRVHRARHAGLQACRHMPGNLRMRGLGGCRRNAVHTSRRQAAGSAAPNGMRSYLAGRLLPGAHRASPNPEQFAAWRACACS